MTINEYTGCTRSQTFKSPPPAYLRNAPEFWKTVKNVFNQLQEDLIWLKKLFLFGVGGAQF